MKKTQALVNLAKELVAAYTEGKVNPCDIRAAIAENKDIAARQETAGCGLVALAAGTWTPSWDWVNAASSLVADMEEMRKQTEGLPGAEQDNGDNGYDGAMWRVYLAQLEEQCLSLETILTAALAQ